MAGGRIVAAFLQLATLLTFASWVTPGIFGIVSSVVAFAIIPQALFDFGIATYVIRHRAASVEDGSVSYALRLSNFISIVLSILAISAFVLLGLVLNPLFFWLIPLAVWVGAERNADIWLGVALADGDAHLNVVSLVGRRFASFLIMLTLFVRGVEPVLAFTCALAVSSTLAALIGQRKLRARLPPPVALGLLPLIRLTWPYWLHSTATQVRNVDTAIVLLVTTPVQAGLYAVASRLTGPLRILPVSLAAVVLPDVARSKGALTPNLVRGIFLMIGAMSAFYVIAGFTAPYLFEVLLSADYFMAIPAIQVVCYGLIFGAVASILASVLQARGYQRKVAASSVITSLYCVPAIAFGANNWGSVGAAVALVSSFSLQAALLLISLIRALRGGSTLQAEN